MVANRVAIVSVDSVYHFFPGDRLTVGHSQFRAHNQGASAATLEIVRAAFVVNHAATPLDAYHVYSGDTEIGRIVRLAPSTDQTLRITFPEQMVGLPTAIYAIRVELLIDGGDRRVVDCPIRVFIERSAK